MKNSKLEQVSALVDDEFPAHSGAPVESLLKDLKLRATWQRYHELGDWMRGSAGGRVIRVDVADRVRLALESEPTLLFPANRRPLVVTPPASRRWSQLAGMGMAAAVASVTVLLFQQTAEPDSPAVSAMAANQPVVRSPALTVAAAGSGDRAEAGADENTGQAFQQKLDAYLASHVRQSAGHRPQGQLPNATVVGYGVTVTAK